MISVVGVGGVPSSGKSTLFRALLESFGEADLYKTKTLKYMRFSAEKLIVLGVYGCGGFEGTDKLAMNVQPQAVAVMQHWSASKAMDGWTVLFEGDRLFNKSFLDKLAGMKHASTKFVVLTLPDEEFAARQNARGNKQNPNWLKGRVTKVSRIVEALGLDTWVNATDSDLCENKERLIRLLAAQK